MAHKIYEELFVKNRVLYSNLYSSYFEDKDKEVQHFLTALGKYANVVNEGYSSLHYSKNFVCMAHLLRMMADACYCAYGLLLADNKQGYISNFFAGKATNKCKKDGEFLSTKVIGRYIEQDYSSMSTIFEECNRYIHPTSFFFHNYKEKEESGQFTLLSDYSDLFSYDEVKRLDKIISVLNEILLDIMDRIYKYYYPPLVIKDKIQI